MPQSFWDGVPLCIYQNLTFINRGATSWVFKKDENIAIKYARKGRLKQFQLENDTYELLLQRGHHPCFVQSFLRLPGVHFMQFLPSGSLEQRIHGNQQRDDRNRRCLELLRLEPIHKVEQWAAELSEAIAWLASLGLAHGDLRPANMLLDHDDHLKLADFDCIAQIGSRVEGGPPPWSRHLRHDEPEFAYGAYGRYGATSEQFAFGSVLYTLTRGIELYEDRGSESVRLLIHQDFPEMSDEPLDQVIHRCWRGEYASLSGLAHEMAGFEGSKAAVLPPVPSNGEYIAEMRGKCLKLLEHELLGITVELSEKPEGEEKEDDE